MTLPQDRRAAWLATGLAVTFLTLANVSHTIALRYALLLGMLCWAVAERKPLWQTLRASVPARWLAAFLAYGLVHALWLSAWPEASVSEWRGQLLMGGLWFVGGTVLFLRRRALSVMDCVVLAGMLLVGAEVLLSLHYRLTYGMWPYMEVFTTATKLEFTFFVNFAMVFVAILAGFGQGKTRFPLWLLLLTGALMFFASFHAGARNGLIGLAYLVVSFSLIYVLTHRQQISLTRLLSLVLLVAVGLGSFVYQAVQKDARNQVFVESAVMAWQDRDGNGWLRTGPYPRLANGQMVDDSAYERVAWIRAGIDLIAARPWGYGFDRRAFARALTVSGHANKVGHSHSGFIDLGVGLGVPGILLWLGFCLSLLWQGLCAFTRRRDLAGLALMLVTCGFMGRMLLESVSKDHMLHLFLFTIAALLAQMQLNQTEASNE